MRKVVLCFALVLCMIAISATPATVSAATATKARITYSKGVIIKVAGGTGYAVTGKHLKKGTPLILKAVSNNSKVAKTYAYGKAKGWSNKKLAKALKRAKAYKAKVSGIKVFKAYKGKKLRYIVVVNCPAAKKPAKPKPVNKPKTPAKPSASSSQTQPGTTPAAQPAPTVNPADPIIEDSTVEVLKEAELTIKVASTDANYDSPVYDLNGTLVVVKSGAKSYPLRLEGGNSEVTAQVTVPEGDYRISFPRTTDEIQKGLSPYWFPAEAVSVQGNTVMEIELDPVPGQLSISLTEETAATDPEVLIDDNPVDAPCELNLVAGDHELEMLVDGESVMNEDIYVKPGLTEISL